MANLFELFAKIDVDTSAFERGMTTVGKVGGIALAAASAAVVKLGTDAIEAGKAFDKSMSQVVATMGYSVEELNNETSQASKNYKALNEFAQEMGRTTAFSATEAADALNYMALAGYDVNESMTMLPNVLNLAAAGTMDLGRASDMLTDTQTALGLSFERTEQLTDEMAKTASTTNTSVEQLGDAILTIGATAKTMSGGMIELADGTKEAFDGTTELNMVLGVLADNGIKGSEAGTHLRNILLKLSSPTEKGAAALENLGVKIFDAEGNMRSFTEIFPELNSAMENLTEEEKLQALSEIFNTRDIASANALLSTTKKRWNEVGKAIKDSEGSAKEMAEVQLDNLAGDITLFNSALEGARIALSDHLTPTLREFVQLGTEGISDIASSLKEGDFAKAAEMLGDMVGDGVVKITEKLPDIIEAGGNIIKGIIQGFVDNSDSIADGIADTVVAIVEFFTDNIGTFVGGAITIAGKVVAGLITNLPEIMVNLVEGIANGFLGLAQGLASALESVMSAVFGLFDTSGLADSFTEEAGKILDESKKIADEYEKIDEKRKKLIDGANDEYGYYNGLWEELKKITDENGKIQEGYEARAAFITDELSGYTGTEIELVGDVIEGYETLSKTIDEAIEKQRAMAILEAEKQAFQEAIKIRDDITTQLADIDAQLEGSEEAIASKISTLEGQAFKMYLDTMDMSNQEKETLLRNWAEQELGIDGLTERYEDLNKDLENVYRDIAIYEEDAALAHQGAYDKIGKATREHTDTYKKSLYENIEDLKSTKKAQEIELEAIKKNVENWGLSKTYGAELEAAIKDTNDKLAILTADYDEEISKIGTSTQTTMQFARDTLATETANGIGDARLNARTGIPELLSEFDVMYDGMYNATNEAINGMVQGTSDNDYKAYNAFGGLASGVLDWVYNIFGIQSPSKKMAYVGEMLMQGMSKGVDDNSQEVFDSIEDMANGINDIMDGTLNTDYQIGADVTTSGSGSVYENSTRPIEINMNIYGSESQDVKELADEVISQLQRTIRQEVSVYA